MDAGEVAPPAGVVRFLTPAQREAELQQAERDLAHDEAVAMLRRLLAHVESHRLSGLVIAFVEGDGSIGRLVPLHSVDVPRLIAAAGVAHHDLILKTLTG